MSLYVVSDTTLTSLAQAIRNKSGKTNKLIFPKEYISEINNLITSLDLDTYNGNYNVIPMIDTQTLDTKNKLLEEDISIKGIPYYEISNNFGNTVYIGSDLNA